MPKTYDLGAYRRHAERFGPELVMETAATDLGVRDLGYLSLTLQRVYPKWTPPLDRTAFAQNLIAAGETTQRACRMAAISPRTLRRAEDAQTTPPDLGPRTESGSQPQYRRGEKVTNRGGQGVGLPHPNLSTSRPHNGLERGKPIPGQLNIYDALEPTTA